MGIDNGNDLGAVLAGIPERFANVKVFGAIRLKHDKKRKLRDPLCHQDPLVLTLKYAVVTCADTWKWIFGRQKLRDLGKLVLRCKPQGTLLLGLGIPVDEIAWSPGDILASGATEKIRKDKSIHQRCSWL